MMKNLTLNHVENGGGVESVGSGIGEQTVFSDVKSHNAVGELQNSMNLELQTNQALSTRSSTVDETAVPNLLNRLANKALDEAEKLDKGSVSLGAKFPAGTQWCDVEDEAEASHQATGEGRQGTQTNINNNNNASTRTWADVAKASPQVTEEGRRSQNSTRPVAGTTPMACLRSGPMVTDASKVANHEVLGHKSGSDQSNSNVHQNDNKRGDSNIAGHSGAKQSESHGSRKNRGQSQRGTNSDKTSTGEKDAGRHLKGNGRADGGRVPKKSKRPDRNSESGPKCFKCDRYGHKQNMCNSSGRSVKKTYKFNKDKGVKDSALADMQSQLAAQKDVSKELAAELKEEKEGEKEVVEIRTQNGVEVSDLNEKLADKIEKFKNQNDILTANTAEFIAARKLQFAGKTYSMEFEDAQTEDFERIEPDVWINYPSRRLYKYVFAYCVFISMLANFIGYPLVGLLGVGFAPIVVLGYLFFIFAFNSLLNAHYSKVRIFRTYRLLFEDRPELSTDLNSDQRPLCNGQTDVVRPNPLIVRVLCHNWIHRSVPRHFGTRGIWRIFLGSARLSRENRAGCICERRSLPCMCDNVYITNEMGIGVERSFEISFELLMEVLASNPVVKNKSVVEARAMLLSSAKRVHSINISRFGTVSNLVAMTAEFGTVVVMNQQRQSDYLIPINESAPIGSGRFSV